jgi:hypothetical protein
LTGGRRKCENFRKYRVKVEMWMCLSSDDGLSGLKHVVSEIIKKFVCAMEKSLHSYLETPLTECNTITER